MKLKRRNLCSSYSFFLSHNDYNDEMARLKSDFLSFRHSFTVVVAYYNHIKNYRVHIRLHEQYFIEFEAKK